MSQWRIKASLNFQLYTLSLELHRKYKSKPKGESCFKGSSVPPLQTPACRIDNWQGFLTMNTARGPDARRGESRIKLLLPQSQSVGFSMQRAFPSIL